MSWTPEVSHVVSLSMVRLTKEVAALTEALTLATETLRCAKGALLPPQGLIYQPGPIFPNPNHALNVGLYCVTVLSDLERREEVRADDSAAAEAGVIQYLTERYSGSDDNTK